MKRFLSLFVKKDTPAPVDAPNTVPSQQREEVKDPIEVFLDELYNDLSFGVKWQSGMDVTGKYITHGEFRMNVFTTEIQMVWPNGVTESLSTSYDETYVKKIKQIIAMANYRWESLEDDKEKTALLKMSERYRKHKIPK